jgi:hypothetical protein
MENDAMDQTAIRVATLLTFATLLLSLLLATPAMAAPPSQISTDTGIIGGGTVSRATFTEAVVNREPKNRITELPNNKQYIYYFTELKGMAGQNISHRWLLDGKPMYEMKFNVGSPRWRIWSSLPLQQEWLGRWEVQVVNEMGQVVHSDSFKYIQSDAIQKRR